MTPVPERIATYLAEQGRRRASAVARARGAMEPREAHLVREAAVMGFVQGQRHADMQVPRDEVVVDLVVDACVHFADLYPVTASLSEHRRSHGPREEQAAAVLKLHPPRCSSCTSSAGCSCAAEHHCGTCTDDGASVPWPCPTLAVFGRVAACENYLELEDRLCGGYLVFAPNDVQARCLSCGAWCGAQVADYISPQPSCRPGSLDAPTEHP